MTTQTSDVVVVGGGLAGLAAATFLGRAGHSVTLFEKAHDVGGRARTQEKHGFQFNLGPHALYRHGAGLRVLGELGVPFSGRIPPLAGLAVQDGQPYALPADPRSMLTTRLLPLAAKLELAKLLVTLPRVDTGPIQNVTVQEWLTQNVRHAETQAVMRMFLRVFTYADAWTTQSAGSAIAQAKRAIQGNVLYLDGGWQTLVEGLRRAAEGAGVAIIKHANVATVERDGAACGARLADGSLHSAKAVILATSPAEAAALVQDETLSRPWTEGAVPVTAACLDLGLSYLPKPDHVLGFGVDRPVYLSVHSKTARLAPDGSALIHLAKYGAGEARADEAELEAFADLLQPGWRNYLVERRFLPRMVVANRLDTAAQGGLAGRPNTAVPDVPGLFLAGDWVGHEGLLADAALASAKRAALDCAARLATSHVPARTPQPAYAAA